MLLYFHFDKGPEGGISGEAMGFHLLSTV